VYHIGRGDSGFIIDPMWKTRKHEDMLAHGRYIQSWFHTQYSLCSPSRHAPTSDIRVMRAPQQWNGMFFVSRVHESGCAPVEVGPPILVSVLRTDASGTEQATTAVFSSSLIYWQGWPDSRTAMRLTQPE
jgi:hypothetical protein